MLQGCFYNKPGTWANGQINAGKRADMHALNAEVLKCLRSNNMDSLKVFLSKELIEDSYTLRQMELISNQLKANAFSLYDEYNIVRDSTNADSTINIPSPEKGLNAYSLFYAGDAGEGYIALLLPKKGIINTLSALNITNIIMAGK